MLSTCRSGALFLAVCPLSRLCLKIGAWAGLCIVSAGSACCQQYIQIETAIQLVTYIPQGTNKEPFKSGRLIQAKVTVSTNGVWYIENNFLQNGNAFWYSDTTNVYDYCVATSAVPKQVEDIVRRKFKIGTVPFDEAKGRHSINVSPSIGGIPTRGDAGVNLPWLVFCSGYYLRVPKRTIPAPIPVPSNRSITPIYPDRTDTFQDSLGLPRALDLYTSIEGLQQKDTVPRGTQNRFLKFHYLVASSTNVVGWTIPTEFEFSQNEASRDGAWVRRFEGTGKLTSVRFAEEPGQVLKAGEPMTIVDYRFRDERKPVDAIIYTSTNGFLLPTSDPGLQNLFRDTVEKAPASPAVNRLWIRISTIALILFAACFPVVLSRYNKTHAKQHNI